MTPKRTIIPIFVPHLGCPHMCVFCDQKRISGAQAPPDGDDVTASVRKALSLLPRDAHKTVAFYGGSFTAIPAKSQEELLGAAYEFIKRGEVRDIRLSTRPDCIDDETLSRLEGYGVKTIELGVQSLCDDVLAASGRGHTAAQAEKAASMVKEAGFELILQMMTGLPGDTREKTVATAKKIIALAPDGVRIYPTVIIENTALCDMYRAGTYPGHTVEEAAEWGAELLSLFSGAGIEVIRFGLNPTEELSGGAAVAGAYHPALRELAESRRYRRAIEELLTFRDAGLSVIFGIPRGKTSQAVGQKRENVEYLKEKFGLSDVIFRETDLEPGQLVLRISR